MDSVVLLLSRSLPRLLIFLSMSDGASSAQHLACFGVSARSVDVEGSQLRAYLSRSYEHGPMSTYWKTDRGSRPRADSWEVLEDRAALDSVSDARGEQAARKVVNVIVDVGIGFSFCKLSSLVG